MNCSSTASYKSGWTRATFGRLGFVFCILSAIILFAAMRSMAGDEDRFKSKWDTALPSMELRNVRLHAAGRSVSEVWRDVASQTRVRAVLFATQPQTEVSNQDVEFKFDRTNCVVQDLLDAFASAFPDFAFSQDPATGVLWLHPANVAYNDILNGKIKVTRPAEAVPMFTEILAPLAVFPSLHLGLVCATGGGLMSVNYPVDLPAGTFTVRDMVNCCCVACPDRTWEFLPSLIGPLHDSYGYSCFLVCPYGKPLPPGAEFFWPQEIDPSVLQEPTKDQLIAALASKDSHIRWAARQ
jgi:hypothetical protein